MWLFKIFWPFLATKKTVIIKSDEAAESFFPKTRKIGEKITCDPLATFNNNSLVLKILERNF